MSRRAAHRTRYPRLQRRHPVPPECVFDSKGECTVRGEDVVLKASFVDRKGKPHSKTFDTVKEALAWQRAGKVKADRGEPTIGHASIRVGDFIDKELLPYIARMVNLRRQHPDSERRSGLKETAASSLQSSLVHVKAIHGVYKLADLDEVDIVEACSKLTEKGREGATVHHLFLAYRKMFELAVERRYVAMNPAHRVKSQEIPHPARRRLEVWPREVRARFVAEVEGSELEVPVKLALASGFRRGEQNGLRWSDIDFDKGVIHVRRSRTMVRGRPVETSPKSQTATRPVTIKETTLAMLREVRAGQVRTLRRDGYVFAARGGDPVDPDRWTRAFAAKVAELELPPARWHDLRHCHAQSLLEAGVPLEVVSKRLGHSSYAITADIYQHFCPELDAVAATVSAW